MSRVTDALLGLTPAANKAYAKGRSNLMVDLAYGAQMGFSPNLEEWVSNAAHVRRHGFFLLLEAPRFFQSMPDPNKWTQCLRMLMEVHPVSIEGFNAGLKVDTDNTPVGGGGLIHEEITNVTREPSTPKWSWNDKYGSPINNFLRAWIEYGMLHPESKIANVATLGNNPPTDMLPDQYTATGIFIEPDPLFRKVVRSWLCTNLFPKSDGDIVGSRNIREAMSILTLDVEFACIAQYGLGPDAVAQKLLDQINITNANPHLRPGFIQDYHADINANDVANFGFESHIEKMGESALTGI